MATVAVGWGPGSGAVGLATTGVGWATATVGVTGLDPLPASAAGVGWLTGSGAVGLVATGVGWATATVGVTGLDPLPASAAGVGWLTGSGAVGLVTTGVGWATAAVGGTGLDPLPASAAGVGWLTGSGAVGLATTGVGWDTVAVGIIGVDPPAAPAAGVGWLTGSGAVGLATTGVGWATVAVGIIGVDPPPALAAGVGWLMGSGAVGLVTAGVGWATATDGVATPLPFSSFAPSPTSESMVKLSVPTSSESVVGVAADPGAGVEGRGVGEAETGASVTGIRVGLPGVTVGVFVFGLFDGKSVADDSSLPTLPPPSLLVVPVGVVLSPLLLLGGVTAADGVVIVAPSPSGTGGVVGDALSPVARFVGARDDFSVVGALDIGDRVGLPGVTVGISVGAFDGRAVDGCAGADGDDFVGNAPFPSTLGAGVTDDDSDPLLLPPPVCVGATVVIASISSSSPPPLKSPMPLSSSLVGCVAVGEGDTGEAVGFPGVAVGMGEGMPSILLSTTSSTPPSPSPSSPFPTVSSASDGVDGIPMPLLVSRTVGVAELSPPDSVESGFGDGARLRLSVAGTVGSVPPGLVSSPSNASPLLSTILFQKSLDVVGAGDTVGVVATDGLSVLLVTPLLLDAVGANVDPPLSTPPRSSSAELIPAAVLLVLPSFRFV